jgi:hypothetical protein
MKPLWWMGGVGLLSWLGLAALAGDAVNPELFYGMAGPLAATGGTWIVMARTYESSPERLTGIMVVGLAVKAVFFAVYVALVLRVLHARPGPFVLSFTAYFVTLYGMEALFLRRLFAGGTQPLRG